MECFTCKNNYNVNEIATNKQIKKIKELLNSKYFIPKELKEAAEKRLKQLEKGANMKESDQLYLMHTALLECSIEEKRDLECLRIFKSRKTKGLYYIIDNTLKDKKGSPKVWFKKQFKEGGPK